MQIQSYRAGNGNLHSIYVILNSNTNQNMSYIFLYFFFFKLFSSAIIYM